MAKAEGVQHFGTPIQANLKTDNRHCAATLLCTVTGNHVMAWKLTKLYDWMVQNSAGTFDTEGSIQKNYVHQKFRFQ